MAHFAKINSDNMVVHVSSVSNKYLLNEDGTESEVNGISHLERHGSEDGFQWKQTSYNTSGNEHTLGGTPFRKNYAGIGSTYNSNLDAFIYPKPYNSWVLDESTCTWIAPVARPDGEYTHSSVTTLDYDWNEETQSWIAAADR